MWDYDKLFAEGNVVGLKNVPQNRIFPSSVDGKEYWGKDGYVDWRDYRNESLSDLKDENGQCCFEIMYVVRLDEHGNVIEKLFDREKDMPKPMPELETGMFVRVARKYCTLTNLGYIDREKNVIIYQDGDFDYITGPFGINHWKFSKLVEVYGKHIQSFNECNLCSNPLWRSPEY